MAPKKAISRAGKGSPPWYTDLPGQAKQLALGEHYLSRYIPLLLLLCDALLCTLIISKVACKFLHTLLSGTQSLIATGSIDTEIDWKAYMEQVELYVNGERDYLNIKGGTGPLVYPAGHVYIYWALYHITDKGTNILLAQGLFGLLYLVTLAIVMACYQRAKVYPSPAALK